MLQVPGSSVDGVLFAALAVLAACLLHFSRLPAVLVLLAGAGIEAVLVLPRNLGRLGNAFSIWLGIDPELFFFVFLPPLLLDSALSVDWCAAAHARSAAAAGRRAHGMRGLLLHLPRYHGAKQRAGLTGRWPCTICCAGTRSRRCGCRCCRSPF